MTSSLSEPWSRPSTATNGRSGSSRPGRDTRLPCPSAARRRPTSRDGRCPRWTRARDARSRQRRSRRHPAPAPRALRERPDRSCVLPRHGNAGFSRATRPPLRRAIAAAGRLADAVLGEPHRAVRRAGWTAARRSAAARNSGFGLPFGRPSVRRQDHRASLVEQVLDRRQRRRMRCRRRSRRSLIGTLSRRAPAPVCRRRRDPPASRRHYRPFFSRNRSTDRRSGSNSPLVVVPRQDLDEVAVHDRGVAASRNRRMVVPRKSIETSGSSTNCRMP